MSADMIQVLLIIVLCLFYYCVPACYADLSYLTIQYVSISYDVAINNSPSVEVKRLQEENKRLQAIVPILGNFQPVTKYMYLLFLISSSSWSPCCW